MYLRRRLSGTTLITETSPHLDDPDSWTPADAGAVLGFTSPFAPEWEVAHARAAGVADGGIGLPFAPLAFREYMLFEQHYVNAARGYVRRFRPRLAAFTDVAERVTGRTFPSFRAPRFWHRQPMYYLGNATTIVPSGTPVAAPPYSTALDYELELAFVLREPLLDATPAQAEAAIGAAVVLCDFTARDVQLPEMESGFGPQKSKHFVTSLSATAVTADEVLADWSRRPARIEINGEVVAKPDQSQPRWSIGEVLAHASAGERLEPGEIVATGTFVGGCAMENGHWVQPGDTLRLVVEGVGEIEHRIR